MDWTAIITALIGAILGGGGSLLYFRPKLREANVGADKVQFDALQERIESLTELYRNQGTQLDDMRSRVLEMVKEMQAKDERIAQLESENRSLGKKVQRLEKEQSAYKQLLKK